MADCRSNINRIEKMYICWKRRTRIEKKKWSIKKADIIKKLQLKSLKLLNLSKRVSDSQSHLVSRLNFFNKRASRLILKVCYIKFNRIT